MICSFVAVLVNFVFNSLLIFGMFGFPKLGPAGAAIATVISRFAEFCLYVFIAHKNRFRFPFFQSLIKKFKIPKKLFKDITKNGVPLIANEILYSVGIAAVTQSYSVRGIEALAAYNISSTIIGLFLVFHYSMGDCISIMVGRELGSGNIEEAVDTDRKLIVFSAMMAAVIVIVLFFIAPVFPNFYNTSAYVRETAANLLKVGGLCLWIASLYNASYYTLRCGGKTVITLLFDSIGTIFVSFPISYLLAHYTNLDIVHMYMIICLIDLYKVVLGIYLVRKGIWIKNLAEEN